MDRSRTSELEAARGTLGLSMAELWLDYFSLGGKLLPAAISAILSADLDLNDHDHDLLAQALNDHFLDLDRNHPLPYADELPPTE